MSKFPVPRALTEEEIEEIVSIIPEISTCSPDISKQLRSEIQQKLRYQLQSQRLVPLGIGELKQQILRQYYASLVPAGEPVGVRAAESIAAPITQVTLSSIHASGTKRGVSTGINAMTEILDAVKNRANPSLTIHFKNKKLSYEEVFWYRSEYIETTVGSLIKDYDISPIEGYPQQWWHQAYSILHNKKIPKSNWVLHLTLNVDHMYTHQITMEELARAIEIDTPPSVVCICSPLSEGIIDIYPVETAIGSSLQEMALGALPMEQIGQTFLNLIVMPNLGKIVVKGIKKISSFFPVESPVWQLILEQRLLYNQSQIEQEPNLTQRDRMSRTWILQFNKYKSTTTGLTSENIAELCRVTDIEVERIEKDFMIIVMPDSKLIPNKYVQERIEKDRKAQEETKKQLRQKGERFLGLPPTPIARASTYVYAETNGSNLLEVLARPEVDTNRTVSNDFHEMASVFGIEVASNYLMKELYEVIMASNSYINFRHISLLVHYMTNRGDISAVNYRGFVKQGAGAIASSSFQQAAEILKKAALTGAKESTEATTTRIYTGQRMKKGTGIIDIIHDQEREDQLLAQLEKEKITLTPKESEELLIRAKALEVQVDSEDLEAMFAPSIPLPALALEQEPPVKAIVKEPPPLVPVSVEIPIIPTVVLPNQLLRVAEQTQVTGELIIPHLEEKTEVLTHNLPYTEPEEEIVVRPREGLISLEDFMEQTEL